MTTQQVTAVGARQAQRPVIDNDIVAQQLVARMRCGDVAAYGQLYDMFNQAVFSYLYLRTADDGLTKALTTKVWNLVRTRITGHKGNVLAWVLSIAHHEAEDCYGENYVVQATDRDVLPREGDAADGDVGTVGALALLKNLTSKQQEYLVLVTILGVSNAAAAHVIDVKPAYAQTMHARALKTMAAFAG